MDTPTTDPPQPPPEATLIKRAREARGLSVEDAAAKVPLRLGPTRWRQIEVGYERRDPPKPTRAPAKTLAHMAHVVGVSPEQLDEAGRGDAADVLREMRRQEAAAPATSRPAVPTSLSEIPGGVDLDPVKGEMSIAGMTQLPEWWRVELILHLRSLTGSQAGHVQKRNGTDG